MVRALGKTWILNKVFNKDTDTLKVALYGQNGPVGFKYRLVTGDIGASDLVDDDYSFDPTVDAILVLNTGILDLSVTIGDMMFSVVPDEVRVISLPDKIELVAFNAGAVFRMNGLNRG
ncbi:MAG: hypothetical protein Q8M06_11845 [Methanobacteriaceae archaeon]|nr:hypothetical protein [Methanobacteriaceae archaeon]